MPRRLRPTSRTALRTMPWLALAFRCDRSRERVLSPHADEYPHGDDQPSCVRCQHEREVIARERPGDLLTKNDVNGGKHHGRPDDRPVTDPLLALPERVERSDVEGTVDDLVDTDDRRVPDGPLIEQRIVILEVPVQEVDHIGRRPDRIGEIVRVADDELLDICLVRHEDDVDQKEDPQRYVLFALAERDDLACDDIGHQSNSIGRLVGPFRPSSAYHGTVNHTTRLRETSRSRLNRSNAMPTLHLN